MKGKNIGGFIIEEEIGKGGFGTVYKARNERTSHIFALKVANRDCESRLMEEATTLEGLMHENIVAIKGIHTSDNITFMIMEYIDGNLRKQIGKSDQKEMIEEAKKILKGLDYLHGCGLIHGDLKPENVLQGKLGDFGLSRTFTQDDIDSFTKTQAAMGSAYYVAPEVLEGKKPDARADIYSFGFMLYEMLKSEKPIGAYESTGNKQLDQVILKCMQRNPEKRYSTAKEVLLSLEKAMEEPAAPIAIEEKYVKGPDLEKKAEAYQPAPHKKKVFSKFRLGVSLATLGLVALVGVYVNTKLQRYFDDQNPANSNKAAIIKPENKWNRLVTSEKSDLKQEQPKVEPPRDYDLNYECHVKIDLPLTEVVMPNGQCTGRFVHQLIDSTSPYFDLDNGNYNPLGPGEGGADFSVICGYGAAMWDPPESKSISLRANQFFIPEKDKRTMSPEQQKKMLESGFLNGAGQYRFIQTDRGQVWKITLEEFQPDGDKAYAYLRFDRVNFK